MSSNSARAERWIDRALGHASRDLGPRGTVFYEGDTIYSYGRHFPMATVHRDKAGEPTFVLVNGDRFSVTTSGHQSLTRSVIATRSNLPSLIVPFSALDGAGIDPASIVPVDVREDRNETTPHESDTAPGEPGTVTMDDPSGATETYTVTEYWGDDGKMLRPPREVERERPVQVPDPYRVRAGRSSWAPIAERGADGIWRWETTRHLLGDSLFTARAAKTVTRDADDKRQWTPLWRGRRTFLSSFDYQESTPLYFLCELPRGADAWNVEQALEALRPPLVLAADAAGLDVTRQGDLFAVPATLTTREVKRQTPRGKGRIVKRPAQVLGTNHTASAVMFATGDRVYARGTLYHEPGEWRESDHARRRMGDGKTWHLLTRNTVPRTNANPARVRA